MDSLVAPYTLIQIARTVENDYLLRWHESAEESGAQSREALRKARKAPSR
jgi:hypothetical protein